MNVDVFRPDEAKPAGFWIRAVALVVDFVLFALVQFSLGFAAGRLWGRTVEESVVFQLLVVVFTIVFTGVYTTTLHALTGQTLGKLITGVRVVDGEGGPLSVGPALLRYFAYYASLLPLATGFVMAGLRRDKRALHDLIAGSRVEHLPARRRAGLRVSMEPSVPTDAG